MSINLEKNRESIVQAWKAVVDTKSPTDWALFTYEGQTNVLKLQETGEDGISELAAELNSGKIQYGFLRVANNETGIAKFVFINWQGEGAPTSRKGTCAKHVGDVTNLLKGAHITIHATNEDDVEEARVLEKLQKVVVNDFKVKDYSQANDTPNPVGTNYCRVIPTKEINPAERDEFWRKEEEEEKHRLQLEYERKLSETVKLEEERRRREEREYEKREAALDSPQSPDKSYARQASDSSKIEREREIKQVVEASGKVSSAKARFLSSTAQLSPTHIQQQVQQELVLSPDSSNEERSLINELKAELEVEESTAIGGAIPEVQAEPVEFFDPNATIDLSDEDNMIRARALYDYQAADESEISFDPGDIITHIDQIDEGWWQGLAPDGTYGLFPANYVELI
ncbi:drebrin-like protein isoform X2 [Toxorhynchites rutilus septentrionalis]|uniref:drebrin-like protein isoform X2 n=1 Tax=Toxorhynchites rutilus septentrionalis TaxID=329112 RepID=UPI002479FDE2|nr:drebrin-like protein isoform X2 [Toxorhynchites rutilus septentrionalis]